mmetsp:Transcript_2192/g.8833  ORF Transcript_2192/g.8833 Transcript_2192/m.8833 type:complete len:315 (+) Transcript_2192:960-1904(+)
MSRVRERIAFAQRGGTDRDSRRRRHVHRRPRRACHRPVPPRDPRAPPGHARLRRVRRVYPGRRLRRRAMSNVRRGDDARRRRSRGCRISARRAVRAGADAAGSVAVRRVGARGEDCVPGGGGRVAPDEDGSNVRVAAAAAAIGDRAAAALAGGRARGGPTGGDRGGRRGRGEDEQSGVIGASRRGRGRGSSRRGFDGEKVGVGRFVRERSGGGPEERPARLLTRDETVVMKRLVANVRVAPRHPVALATCFASLAIAASSFVHSLSSTVQSTPSLDSTCPSPIAPVPHANPPHFTPQNPSEAFAINAAKYAAAT